MSTTESQFDAQRMAVRPPAHLQHVEVSREDYQKLHESQELWSRLAVRLLHYPNLFAPWVVSITSSIPGEGKTATSIGIAVALAHEAGGRVALVEAELSRPSLAEDFGLGAEPGLLDYLLGRCSLWETCKETATQSLTVLPAGSAPHAGDTLLMDDLRAEFRRQLPQIIRRLREHFHYIVIDLPPLLGSLDAEEVLRLSDGAILVVRAGVTPVEKFRDAVRQLDGVQLLGVVHLGPPSRIPRWLGNLLSE